MHYKRHAKEVVSRFKRMLEPEQVETVSEEHFEELETLIAAALGVVDSQCKHEIAQKVALLAKSLKHEAEHVDTHYLEDMDFNGILKDD